MLRRVSKIKEIILQMIVVVKALFHDGDHVTFIA